MTTARDYKLVSDALREARPDHADSPNMYWGWKGACEAIGRGFKKRNPNFDTQRFLHACGVADAAGTSNPTHCIICGKSLGENPEGRRACSREHHEQWVRALSPPSRV